MTLMSPADKPLVWLHGEIKKPPFSADARLEAGYLLRQLQQGRKIGMPHSRPMPSIAKNVHELRIRSETANWRIDVAGKGGCYLTTAPIRQYQVEFRAECASWLEQLRAHLAGREPYDALIVTHFEAFPILTGPGETQLEAEVEGLVEAWSEHTAGSTAGVP